MWDFIQTVGKSIVGEFIGGDDKKGTPSGGMGGITKKEFLKANQAAINWKKFKFASDLGGKRMYAAAEQQEKNARLHGNIKNMIEQGITGNPIPWEKVRQAMIAQGRRMST